MQGAQAQIRRRGRRWPFCSCGSPASPTTPTMPPSKHTTPPVVQGGCQRTCLRQPWESAAHRTCVYDGDGAACVRVCVCVCVKGMMKGSIHPKLLALPEAEHFQTGAVLVLQNVWDTGCDFCVCLHAVGGASRVPFRDQVALYRPTPSELCLNITPRNLLRIYPSAAPSSGDYTAVCLLPLCPPPPPPPPLSGCSANARGTAPPAGSGGRESGAPPFPSRPGANQDAGCDREGAHCTSHAIKGHSEPEPRRRRR